MKGLIRCFHAKFDSHTSAFFLKFCFGVWREEIWGKEVGRKGEKS